MHKVNIKGSPLSPVCEADSCERKPRTRVDGLCLCGLHEQRQRRYGRLVLPERVKVPWGSCSQPECDRPSRTRDGALCEVHYYRWYRKKCFDDPVYGCTYVTSHGYVVARNKHHPLSGSNGHLYQHRAVLYDAIGSGEHACYWCKQPVEWLAKGKNKLVVDHLDGIKTHNDLYNLVPSCHRCNANRGLFMEWVIRHKDDPFLHDLFELAKSRAA